jgi:hypothetical protein
MHSGNADCFEIDTQVFQEAFARSPFRFHHRLTNHPLFEIERLVELAERLPPASVEHNSGNLPIAIDGQGRSDSTATIEDTIRNLSRRDSWVALLNVEQVQAYRDLLQDCLTVISRYSESIHSGMRQGEGFVFLSSPGATTPYHMDPEHNFLIQIHGRKTVTVFDGARSEVVRASDLERFYSGVPHRNMPLLDSAQPFARAYDLRPGEVLHIPVAHPHYVRVSPTDYSISFSVTFRTPELSRKADVHYFNGFLRSKGLVPTPCGDSWSRDVVKRPLGWLLRRVRKVNGLMASA